MNAHYRFTKAVKRNGRDKQLTAGKATEVLSSSLIPTDGLLKSAN